MRPAIPHLSLPVPRLSFLLLFVLTSCDGGPESDDDTTPIDDDDTADCADLDTDGYRAGADCRDGEELDCDDGNYAVYPGAEEDCNQVDDDCDGEADEGSDDHGESTPPAGSFTQVTAGDGFSCAIDIAGTISCWGDDHFAGATSPPAGEFTLIEATAGHACSVAFDQTVHCWGRDDFGQVGGRPWVISS